jgi:hypothetical protein
MSDDGGDGREQVRGLSRSLAVLALLALPVLGWVLAAAHPEIGELAAASSRREAARVLAAAAGASEAAQATFVVGLRWDSLLAVGYGLTLALACVLTTRHQVRYRWAGRVMAGVAAAAALADLVENHAMMQLVDRGGAPAADYPGVHVPLDGLAWLRELASPAGALARLEYAHRAKGALLVAPAAFAAVAVMAWVAGRARRPVAPARAVRAAVRSARARVGSPTTGHRIVEPPGADPGPWGRRLRPLGGWLVADRAEALQVGPPDAIPGTSKVGICFSGGGIRSAAYNLGALQELQASGVLGRADYLAAVSGGSYIASAYSLAATESDAAALEAMPPFAPGSPEEQHLRNRTTYLVPGSGGFVRAVWRLVRGTAVNLVFVGLVLFLVARPYGWALQDRFPLDQTECKVVAGMAAVDDDDPDVVPAGEGVPVLDQQRDESCSEVTFRVLPWSVWALVLLVGGAFAVGLVDVVLRPYDRTARRLETWSFRLLVGAAGVAVALFVVPRFIELLLDRPSWLSEPRAAIVRPIGLIAPSIGALASLLVAAGMVTRAGPGKPTTGATGSDGSPLPPSLADRFQHLLGRLAVGTRELVEILVGAVLAPLAFVIGAVVFAYGGVLARFSPGDLALWLLAFGAFAVIQGVGDINRWSLHPYYKRRLQSAFATRRVVRDGTTFAEEIDFDRVVSFPDLLDRPMLLICAAVNITDYGVLPPGRPVSTFTFCREEIDAGLLGTTETRHLATLLGPHYRRDFTVPAAVAASGAAFAPVMGKMTRPQFRFVLALANVRLGVWLPNPLRVHRWAAGLREFETDAGDDDGPVSFDPGAEVLAHDDGVDVARQETEAAVQDARASLRRSLATERAGSTGDLAARRVASRAIAEAETRLLAARLAAARAERQRERGRAEHDQAADDRIPFSGFPYVPRPTLVFREMLGRFGARARFVYVTDGGHYENLGLVELVRRGCREIYCFDAAGDPLDAFTTLADAATIAETELGVRIDVDPGPIGTPGDGYPNTTDHVVGRIWYPDTPDRPGRIVFAKAAITADLPPEVRSWRRSHAGFPVEGADDQLYTDQRFEAHRALGAHTAVRAIAAMDRAGGRLAVDAPGPRRPGRATPAPGPAPPGG